MPALVNPARSTVRMLLVAALAALALGAASCGRLVPTAPDAGPSGRAAAAAYSGGIGSPEDEVIVTVVPGTDMQDLAADFGATIAVYEPWGCATLHPPAGMIPDTLAARMAGDPRVVTSERNTSFEDAESRQQSFGFDDGNGSPVTAANQPALDLTGLSQAHVASRGQGVLVAVLDTGIDPAHPLFRGRIAGGWDFVDGDADPTDVGNGADDDGDGRVDESYGHGTHVAGIVALAAPEVRLLVVRVLDADGRGDMRTVAAGIRWAQQYGARVINLSLGSLRRSDAVQKALEDAEAAGVLAVASAGNWGSDSPTEFPAGSSHVLAVAACDLDRRGAAFTSYGSFVAMCAPGVTVRSAFPGNRWMLWSGTSMAAPMVSGTAALLLALHPEWGEAQLRGRLAWTARPVTPRVPDMSGKLGAGIVDAARAVSREMPAGGEGGSDEELLRPNGAPGTAPPGTAPGGGAGDPEKLAGR